MPDRARTVFADPKGVRRRVVQAVTLLSAILLLGAAGYFIFGLLIGPQLRLPSIVRDYHARFRALPSAMAPPRDLKDDWRRIAPSAKGVVSAGKPRGASEGVVLGYLSPWDPSSVLSLQRHADQLTHVASEWFTLKGVDALLEEEPQDKTRFFCIRKGMGFLPILRNLDGDDWQPEAVETLATESPAERAAFLDLLAKRLPPGSKGLLVEWSDLDPSYRKEIGQLVREMAERLHREGKELWFGVPTGNDFDALDMEVIAASADRLVAMLYDENSGPGDPGPLASGDWFEGWLKTMMVYGDPGQWVIGLGTFGREWVKKEDGATESLGFADVMARAAQAGIDPAAVASGNENPHFNYVASGPSEQEREVWFLDAVNFQQQRMTIAPYRPGGIGLYRLGEEDPAVWEALRWDPSLPPTAKQLGELSDINLDEVIASTGNGDFISVGEDPKPGRRRVDFHPPSSLESSYVSFPMPEGIVRQGEPGPHQVALTFDDGPDPKWTPRILDILRQKNAPAAFFILGSQAQHYPDLLERIAKEGHEIGNHSYTHANLAEAGDEQIELELNATTRLIEAVTDRSTAYFRPPYNADGTPVQPGEIRALRIARDLGYLTVTQSIDPDDWERPGAEAIVKRVRAQRSKGSVILLHDAGGDRSQTVEALPAIIDLLRARGDEIVPLSKIIGLPGETVMPALREKDAPLSARYVYGGFAVLRFLENAAWTLLMVVTLLALLRVLFFTACALRHRRLELRTGLPREPGFHPPVSVLVAAYNEERVIASTISHLLESDYPGELQVVVVDDGSKDGTVAVASAIAASDPRVTVIRQANAGKAEALNAALSAAAHGLVVMIDADTMVAPDGIRRLVAPLVSADVGAVAGHVRVGNTRHWLGRFQDIEYATAFQIDRRAQDLLGCIVVAPGALSAFRREALEQAGPLNHDTLAEDTDLTLELHRRGWKVVFVPGAHADTEAPERVSALVSQRFRWSYGTLQCLWKHGDLTCSPGSGWLGWFALPSVWVFQVAVVAVTPVLDLLVLWSLWFGHGWSIWPYFVASLVLDALLAVTALAIARRRLRDAWLSLPMRLLYRPLLGYVVWKCVFKALAGSWVRWSKLERTASAIQQKESVPAPSTKTP